MTHQQRAERDAAALREKQVGCVLRVVGCCALIDALTRSSTQARKAAMKAAAGGAGGSSGGAGGGAGGAKAGGKGKKGKGKR